MKQVYAQALTQRIDMVFLAYHAGEDVSPAQRFQVEGFIQAGLALGLMDEPSLNKLKKSRYRLIYGEHGELPFSEAEGASFIPVLMKRAPVRPSTPDY